MNRKLIIAIALLLVAIGLAAYLSQKHKGPEQPAVQKPEETATSTEENLPIWPEEKFKEEDYSGWKTFTHDELGYSIKYPADWIVFDYRKSKGKSIMINPPNAENFTNYISIGIDTRTLEKIKEMYTTSDYYGGKPYSESKILFSNQKVYQFLRVTTTARSRTFIIPYNGKIYYIDTQKDQNQQVQQALASFKFID